MIKVSPKVKKLDCQQVCEELGIELSNTPGVSWVVTYARNFGIGNPVSRQVAEYSREHLIQLEQVLNWWILLNESTLIEFNRKESRRRLIRIVTDAVTRNKYIDLIAVFCPSYKVGRGSIGYNESIGDHTKKLLLGLSKFTEASNKLGVNFKATLYFSDLLLENYNELQKIDYRHQLQLNYRSFFNYIKTLNNSRLTPYLLSDIKAMREVIGEEGIQSCEYEGHKDLINLISERSRVFYIEELGWTETEVQERTRTLFCTYAQMGQILYRLHPNSIMYWVESAYERAPMYNTALEEEIPVIFPSKVQ